jgi:phosphoribosylformylglycinamidine synthase
MDLKAPGNLLYVVGLTRPELGGSHYYRSLGHTGRGVPVVDLQLAPRIIRAMAGAIDAGLVQSCHDCSEGGFAVALAEMAFAGDVGVWADLNALPFEGDEPLRRDDVLLFSESQTRFIVEVERTRADQFERLLDGLPHRRIGLCTESRTLEIAGTTGNPTIHEPLPDLKEAWQSPLRQLGT